MNILGIVGKFSDLVKNYITADLSNDTTLTTGEEQVAHKLFDYFYNLLISNEVKENTIFEYLENDQVSESDEGSDNKNDDDWEPEPLNDRRLNTCKYSIEEATYILKMWNEKCSGKRKRRWSFETFKKHVAKVSCPYDIRRCKKMIENHGNRLAKLAQINTYVLMKCNYARNRSLPINGKQLRTWALQKAREINLQAFKASKTWLTNFKRKHKLTRLNQK